jgi:hypothetical protein
VPLGLLALGGCTTPACPNAGIGAKPCCTRPCRLSPGSSQDKPSSGLTSLIKVRWWALLRLLLALCHKCVYNSDAAGPWSRDGAGGGSRVGEPGQVDVGDTGDGKAWSGW